MYQLYSSRFGRRSFRLLSCLLFNTRCIRKRIYYYKATNQMFWDSLSWHSLIWSAINWSFIRVGLIKPFETKYGADLLQWIIKWLFLYQKRMVVKPRTIPEPFIVIRTDLGCFHCLFVLWFTVYFGWLLYQNHPFHGNGFITVCVKWHNLNNISHIKCKCLSIFGNSHVIFLHDCFLFVIFLHGHPIVWQFRFKWQSNWKPIDATLLKSDLSSHLFWLQIISLRVIKIS